MTRGRSQHPRQESEMRQALFDPGDFCIPAGVVYAAVAGESPSLRRSHAVLMESALNKSQGMRGRAAQEQRIELARERVARMWNVQHDDIGFTGSVADGVSMIANSLDWQPGDNICVMHEEYASVAGPFVFHPAGIEIKVATGSSENRLQGCIDSKTRVIAASHVSYLTGERIDLTALRSAADSVGAILLVDYSQSAGCLPVEPSIADFAVSCGYKWMLGITGLAIVYWNRTRLPKWEPKTAGFNSIEIDELPDYTQKLSLKRGAARFIQGNACHMAAALLADSVDYLSQFRASDVEAHVLALAEELMDRLDGEGIAYTTPRESDRRAANVCIRSPHAKPIADALHQRGIYGWNGRGRIRFSFHGYNSSDDVSRLFNALRDEWRQ
jgi:selenocysteine lyase/cysteine desulfurase